jgi:hypothetical protein
MYKRNLSDDDDDDDDNKESKIDSSKKFDSRPDSSLKRKSVNHQGLSDDSDVDLDHSKNKKPKNEKQVAEKYEKMLVSIRIPLVRSGKTSV